MNAWVRQCNSNLRTQLADWKWNPRNSRRCADITKWYRIINDFLGTWNSDRWFFVTLVAIEIDAFIFKWKLSLIKIPIHYFPFRSFVYDFIISVPFSAEYNRRVSGWRWNYISVKVETWFLFHFLLKVCDLSLIDLYFDIFIHL